MDMRIKIENSEFRKDELPKRMNSENLNPDLNILAFNIGHLNHTLQFLICCTGVFVFYLVYGYLQVGACDHLFKYSARSMVGLIPCLKRCPACPSRIPLKTYLVLALLTLGTMGFSNSSLGYLNYPTQVIFKCCKLIPVLIGGILIQKKSYGLLDFLAAGSMCVGLTLFTLADSQMSPNFNTLGVMMISCALLCDAVIGNLQEKSMKTYKATNTEVVLYSYSIGFVYLFIIMLVSGDLVKGILFCSKHPKETYGYGLLFSLSGYLGIQIVLTLVRTCGALAAATVTTCRKAVTIVISFIFFSKPFTFHGVPWDPGNLVEVGLNPSGNQVRCRRETEDWSGPKPTSLEQGLAIWLPAGYVWSGLIVVLGIYLNIYSKNQGKASLKDCCAKLNQISKWALSRVQHKSYPTDKRLLADV
uniref:Adenosine 3'-phospho 5'-phosphosulfate transporter 2 n=1 Tax=Timema tahoe TaxID=61484 RepID=A0A7R9FI97_9NEOP|nr:unnamed protein product [Timema tahoe]